MDTNEIRQKLLPAIEARDCFLVDVSVTRDDDVTVTIDKDGGPVEMDDCAAVNDAFLELFPRDDTDYSLTVTSAGLDQPFKVLRQYLNAIGSEVDVRLKGGRRLRAKLMEASPESISLEYSLLEAVEGKKKKVSVIRTETIPMGEVNSVMAVIEEF